MSHQRAYVTAAAAAAAVAAAATTSPQLPNAATVEVFNILGQQTPATGHTAPTKGPPQVSSSPAAAVAAAHAKKGAPYPSEYFFILSNMGGLPGMMPVTKRQALDNKSGIPMYQPNATATATAANQQALAIMQLQQQQQFLPAVSSNAAAAAAMVASATIGASSFHPSLLYGSYSAPY